MRFILTSDWHLRGSKPVCRLDENWQETQANAIRQIFEYAEEESCSICVVGDIFNSNNDIPFSLITIIQDLVQDYNRPLFLLAGNHDLPYHSSENIARSGVGVLLGSKNIYHISVYNNIYANSSEYISANDFDQPDNKDANILFKHILTFPDAKHIPPNCEGLTAKELLHDFPKATWIFTGDYHGNFHYEKNSRHVVNAGCLLRQNADMIDYQPQCAFVDTDENIVRWLPIIDSERLVTNEYIKEQNDRDERLNAFVEMVKTGNNVTFDFVHNVDLALKQNDFDDNFNNCITRLIHG